jgi:hypothetical protein
MYCSCVSCMLHGIAVILLESLILIITGEGEISPYSCHVGPSVLPPDVYKPDLCPSVVTQKRLSIVNLLCFLSVRLVALLCFRHVAEQGRRLKALSNPSQLLRDILVLPAWFLRYLFLNLLSSKGRTTCDGLSQTLLCTTAKNCF